MSAREINPYERECLRERERSLAAWEFERAVRAAHRDQRQEHRLYLILRIWHRLAAGFLSQPAAPPSRARRTEV